jgi:hypothetical protein
VGNIWARFTVPAAPAPVARAGWRVPAGQARPEPARWPCRGRETLASRHGAAGCSGLGQVVGSDDCCRPGRPRLLHRRGRLWVAFAGCQGGEGRGKLAR